MTMQLEVNSYHTNFKWEPIETFKTLGAARRYLTRIVNSLDQEVIKHKDNDSLTIIIGDATPKSYDLSYRITNS